MDFFMLKRGAAERLRLRKTLRAGFEVHVWNGHFKLFIGKWSGNGIGNGASAKKRNERKC